MNNTRVIQQRTKVVAVVAATVLTLVGCSETTTAQDTTSTKQTTPAPQPWKTMSGDGTHEMGGVGGKNWGVWESGGAKAAEGCEWSVRMIDPYGPAVILDEGSAAVGERARVAINPVGDANLVFVTSGCQPWTYTD